MLHNYLTKTSMTFLREGRLDDSRTDSWAHQCVGLAFDHEALLYSIIALTALHIAKTEVSDMDSTAIYQDYLDMALKAHQQQLSNITKEIADATCVTSSILRTAALAMLSERTDNKAGQYEPPMQWLQMTGGSGRVYYAAWEFIKDDQDSISMRILNRTPFLSPFNPSLFLESNRQSLLPLLEQAQDGLKEEMWSVEIHEAYALTLSYIGSIIIALRAGEKLMDIGRRLIVFAMLVPKKYISLVAERQPRALVILAFYFSMVSLFKATWYFGDAGEKEVLGIQSAISKPWQYYMKWPMHVLREGSMSIPEPFF